MSAWNHLVCEACWLRREPSRVPVRTTGAPKEACCECGAPTSAGIFVRQAPESLPCAGQFGTHAGEP